MKPILVLALMTLSSCAPIALHRTATATPESTLQIGIGGSLSLPQYQVPTCQPYDIFCALPSDIYALPFHISLSYGLGNGGELDFQAGYLAGRLGYKQTLFDDEIAIAAEIGLVNFSALDYGLIMSVDAPPVETYLAARGLSWLTGSNQINSSFIFTGGTRFDLGGADLFLELNYTSPSTIGGKGWVLSPSVGLRF